jgi:hypothetical protein
MAMTAIPKSIIPIPANHSKSFGRPCVFIVIAVLLWNVIRKFQRFTLWIVTDYNARMQNSIKLWLMDPIGQREPSTETEENPARRSMFVLWLGMRKESEPIVKKSCSGSLTGRFPPLLLPSHE